MRRTIVGLSVVVLLAACSPEASSPPPEAKSASAPAVTAPAPLVSAGAPVTMAAAANENLQWSASVVQLDPLSDLDAKLFGTAGGDPAMNGLYTYIAFFAGPADGWKTFKIGDFLEYRVLAQSKGRVDLAIKESVLNDKTGEIGSRDRNIIVAWTPGADGAVPSAITVTPAQ